MVAAKMNRSSLSIQRVTDFAHPFYGSVKVFDAADTISRTVLAGGEWEPHIADLMCAEVVDGTDVLDIGANLGFSTLGLLKRNCRPAVVHCFEPQPDVHALLQYNVQSYDNVKTYSFALGSGAAEVHGYSQTPTNIGGTHLDSGDRHHILSTSLDTLLARGAFQRPVSLIKIDIEGSESALFDGAQEFFAKHRPVIAMESWVDKVDRVTKQLEALGYARTHIRYDDYLFRSVRTVPRKAVYVGAGSGGGTLIGLVMIVKNEAHGIVETLNSFRPFIDRWTILDTGSTDGTQELIKKTLDGIAGELHEEPFVDFSTSRNRALELHGTSTVFAVMPDSDDYLVDGATLRAFVEARRDAGDEAYGLNIRRGQLSYYLPLVMRTSARWRYSGRVHECCGRPGGQPASVQVPVAQLRQDPKPQSREASRARWHRDLELLKGDKLADPRSSRTSFYLAQTYECLGRPEDALAEYEWRIAIGGWAEETFEAMLRRAKILDALKRWPEAELAFLEAYQFDARRAEPLFAIANHYYGLDQHALVYLFASRALALPKPNTALFVDAEIYEWRAADLVAISGFYLGKRLGDAQALAAGERAADRAIGGRPNDDRLRNNRSFYAKSASELFGGTDQEITWKPELPYRAMNPSVWFDGKQWRCIVRTVNYQIVNGQYLTPDDNVIYTRNYMLELDPDLAIERVVEMVDRDTSPRSSYPVHGFEDCRLFDRDGKLYATSTACDLNDASGNREIVLLQLGEDYGIDKATPLRGPWSSRHQKNWMPVQGVESRFIYATLPERVLEFKEDRVQGVTDPSYGRLRGGSQAVRVPQGWLFLVHDVLWTSGRVYLHRWVLMNDAFKVTAMSDLFYFKRLGIEFCAGLGFDGTRLVASFAVNDEHAYLGVFDLAAVMARLREDFVV
jgi:FkbM family methyltransferase